MVLQARVTVFPDPGRFRPDSFVDLLQHPVQLPGLDHTWTHTLTAVVVAPDGGSAELTVHSCPVAALSLDRHLRIVGSPAAWVRAHDEHGTVMAEVSMPAPLQPGQEVEHGGTHYRVAGEPTWPGRHPDTGVCAGDLDWQHVTLVPAPRPAVVPTPATP